MRGVDFRMRISPRIRTQNRNGLKGSVRDLGQSDLCKNIEKLVHYHVPLISFKEISDKKTSTCTCRPWADVGGQSKEQQGQEWARQGETAYDLDADPIPVTVS
jgi:hypothetical protein